MKRVIFLLCFIISLVNYSYAVNNNTWISIGYSYYLPEESGAQAPLGPVNLTVGGQIMNWVALDLSIGYLWDLIPANNITDVNIMSVRLHALLQPKIETEMFTVLPYFGIGPHVSSNNTDYANNIFSYGFSSKVGVRLMEKGLILGVGVEYLYNPIQFDYKGITSNINCSGFAFGVELGTAF